MLLLGGDDHDEGGNDDEADDRTGEKPKVVQIYEAHFPAVVGLAVDAGDHAYDHDRQHPACSREGSFIQFNYVTLFFFIRTSKIKMSLGCP